MDQEVFVGYNPAMSWVDPDKFLALAEGAGYWRMCEAKEVCGALRYRGSIIPQLYLFTAGGSRPSDRGST